MHRAIKWTLIGIGSIVAVVLLLVAYIAATFDPNDYKDYLVQTVKEKTGRTLTLKGDIGLTFFPSLGMKLGETALSERGSPREFARVGSAVVSVKLMPLLSKRVIVDALEVKGLRATVLREKTGRFNFDDLTATDPKKPQPTSTPLQIDIDHVAISDGDVTYNDQASGAQYRISKLDLKAGRIAPGVTTPVEMSALIASSLHNAQLDTRLKSKVTFDLERKLYKLESLDFATRGTYDTWSAIDATAKGNVEARLESGEYIVSDLAAAVSAKQAAAQLKAKLDTPKLTLTKDKVDGGKLALELNRTEGSTKLVAKVTAGGVQGTFTSFKAAPLEAQIESEGDGRTTKARLAGTLSGNLEAKRFELPNLALNATMNDASLPKGALEIAITGAARADVARETAGLDFTGRIDQSNVSGKAAINRFSPLALRFDVQADQLDADRLLGKSPDKAAKTKQAKSDSPAKEDPIDLSALKGIDAAGTLRFGKLTLMNLKSSQVRADIRIANGRLDVAPLAAQLYQGTLNGSLSAQAATNPIFAVKQQLSNVALGPLLRDAAEIDTLEARGTINVDLNTRGATVDALKKALAGTAAVNLADGAIKGIDIAGAIRGARTTLQQLRGEQVQQSNKSQKTDFSELTGTFNVKDGVAHNRDLSMKSPLLRVGGEGAIDIGNDRINYLLRATVVGTSKGQGGKDLDELSGLTVPVKLTGPLESPQYAIDFSGMAADFAKRRLQDEVLKRAIGKRGADAATAGSAPASGDKKASSSDRTRDVIREGLKGIFGR